VLATVDRVTRKKDREFRSRQALTFLAQPEGRLEPEGCRPSAVIARVLDQLLLAVSAVFFIAARKAFARPQEGFFQSSLLIKPCLHVVPEEGAGSIADKGKDQAHRIGGPKRSLDADPRSDAIALVRDPFPLSLKLKAGNGAFTFQRSLSRSRSFASGAASFGVAALQKLRPWRAGSQERPAEDVIHRARAVAAVDKLLLLAVAVMED